MYMVKGSAYDCDVVKAGTSEGRPVERVAAIQNYGVAHLAGEILTAGRGTKAIRWPVRGRRRL